MKNKKGGTGFILMGIILLIMGGYLLLSKNGQAIVTAVAAVDVVASILLVVFGIVLRRNDGTKAFDDIIKSQNPKGEGLSGGSPVSEENAERDCGFDEAIDGKDVESLSRREAGLREQSKAAAQEAQRLKEEAQEAKAAARSAENELAEAEGKASLMSASEQKSFMRELDRLAFISMEKSKEAKDAYRKAQASAKNAEAVEKQHQRAMDAAAQALCAEEMSEFD